eukprot:scaffold28764_cov59-Phaeocystis_antarctica.AAC.1
MLRLPWLLPLFARQGPYAAWRSSWARPASVASVGGGGPPPAAAPSPVAPRSRLPLRRAQGGRPPAPAAPAAAPAAPAEVARQHLPLLGAQLLLEVFELGAVEGRGMRTHAHHLALERALLHCGLGELPLEHAQLALEPAAARLLLQLRAPPRVLRRAPHAAGFRLEAREQPGRLPHRLGHRRLLLLRGPRLGVARAVARLVARRLQRGRGRAPLRRRLALHRLHHQRQLAASPPLDLPLLARRRRRRTLGPHLARARGVEHGELALVAGARGGGGGGGGGALCGERVRVLVLPLGGACLLLRRRSRKHGRPLLRLHQHLLPVRRATLRLVHARAARSELSRVPLGRSGLLPRRLLPRRLLLPSELFAARRELCDPALQQRQRLGGALEEAAVVRVLPRHRLQR